MKKGILAIFMTAILLATVALAYADTYQVAEQVQIPDQIQSYLSTEKLEGYTATSCITGMGSSSDYAFVLMQGNNGNNTLYVFKQKNNGWNFQYKTNNAVPQGSGRVTVRKEGININGIYIAEENDSGEYWVEYAKYVFQKSGSGTWCLAEYSDRDRKFKVEMTNNRIGYFGGSDYDVFAGYVYGTIQTNMRYVNLSNIPNSIVEARNKYTLAPAIPAGSLSAEVIKFSGGKKYAVYSAPDERSVRNANGKASVSTNDWIQVFGQENGWIMIQYAIDASHYRIGYINAKALPRNKHAQDLILTQTNAITTQAIDLTDDPLFSQSLLLSLPENTPVVWLGTMGDWAYVEVTQPALARGFAPISTIAAEHTFDLQNQPDESGCIVYEGNLTTAQNGLLNINMSIAPDGPLAGVNIEKKQIEDSSSGAVLVVLTQDDAGNYRGSCIFDNRITSLTITAVDINDTTPLSKVTLSW